MLLEGCSKGNSKSASALLSMLPWPFDVLQKSAKEFPGEVSTQLKFVFQGRKDNQFQFWQNLTAFID